MEPGLARVFIFPFIKKQLIIPVKELLMSLFTLAEKWLQDTPQRTYSECIHKPGRALGTTNNLCRQRKCFWISAFPSVCFFVCFSSPSSAVAQICEETGRYGACRLGSVFMDCHQICARGAETAWHCQSWLMGRMRSGCSSPREPGCAAQIAGVEMPIHLVSACAVVFLHGMGWLPSAALSSQLHPERTLRSCPSSTEQGSSSPQQRTSLALMFSASALSLLAWSLCTPLQANFGIPQYWKTLSWLDFRHPFDVTGFQCGLTHNYTV